MIGADGAGLLRANTMWRLAFVVVSGALSFALATGAVGAEHRIKRSKVPAPVRSAVETESAGAVVRGFSRETEGGEIYYEAELRVHGRAKDILIDRNGKIVEVEEEVDLDALPSAVRQGPMAQAGRGTIISVETLTRDGKLVAYEARVKGGAKRSEISVGAEGQPLERQ
jgi:hypothetical protein